MVEFLDGRVLSRHLLEKYYKNPKGWSFTVFPGRQGQDGYGALIGSQDEVWRIQLDSIYNSNPVMLGAKADEDIELIPKPNKNVSYGYRKVDENAILAILKDLENRVTQSESNQGPPPKSQRRRVPSWKPDYEVKATTIERILSSLEPVYPREDEAYVEGPIIITTRKAIQPIVDRQRALEDKMSAELRRLLKQKFSAYG